MNIDETYRVLDNLERAEGISQRRLADELGCSLGKINYLIKSLAVKGYVKLDNFKNSDNKRGYLYVLTPEGISEKLKITKAYLKRREREYSALRAEIDTLRQQIGQDH